MKITMYQVGGAIRDEILGFVSKDIDYAVEISDYEGTTDPFDIMYEAITMQGGEILLAQRNFLSIKAKFPEPIYPATGSRFLRTEPSDFTLCRKEGYRYDGKPYSDGEKVTLGTIYDDLAHRDFTVNAMAKTHEGNILDPHGGMQDLKSRRIRCVGRADERIGEDGLRLLRALRFVVTRDMMMAQDLAELLQRPHFFIPLLQKVSVERVRAELVRCFAHDTMRTLTYLDMYRVFRNTLFGGKFLGGEDSKKIWLKPTVER